MIAGCCGTREVWRGTGYDGQSAAMDGVALVVGEALVDVVEAADGSVVERPGGSATNAAVALSRLMRPVLLATSYGPDERGRLLSEHLVASGVVLATDPHVVQDTSVARARIGPDGAASYDFDVEWRLGSVSVADVEVLHVSSLAPLLDPGADVVAELVERLAPTTTVSYDLNIRPAITGTGPEVSLASTGWWLRPTWSRRPTRTWPRCGRISTRTTRSSTYERSVPATWW